jgi:hypothetical protein
MQGARHYYQWSQHAIVAAQARQAPQTGRRRARMDLA